MSGAVKAVGKVFKAVGHAIKKLWDSPIIKAIVIAAAIYFTAGAAAGYFAAGETAAAGVTAETTAGAFASTTAAEASAASTGLDATLTANAVESGVGAGAAGASDAAAITSGIEAAPGAAGDLAAGGAVGDGAAAAADGAAGAAGAAEGAQPELLNSVPPDAAGAATPGQTSGAISNSMAETNPLVNTSTAPTNATGADASNAGMDLNANSTSVNPTANPTSPMQASNAQVQAQIDAANGGIPSGQGSMWDRITDFLKTKEGLTLAGQAAFGMGKGALDAKAQQEQRDFLAQQRAQYSAVPSLETVYGPNGPRVVGPNVTGGAVARRMGG